MPFHSLSGWTDEAREASIEARKAKAKGEEHKTDFRDRQKKLGNYPLSKIKRGDYISSGEIKGYVLGRSRRISGGYVVSEDRYATSGKSVDPNKIEKVLPLREKKWFLVSGGKENPPGTSPKSDSVLENTGHYDNREGDVPDFGGGTKGLEARWQDKIGYSALVTSISSGRFKERSDGTAENIFELEPFTAEEVSQAKKDAADLQQLAEKNVTPYTKLFHGTVMSEAEVLSIFKETTVIKLPSIYAGTPDRAVAEGYADVEQRPRFSEDDASGDSNVSVMIHMESREGTLPGYTQNSIESILPKGLEFLVLSVKKDPLGKYDVRLKIPKAKKIKTNSFKSLAGWTDEAREASIEARKASAKGEENKETFRERQKKELTPEQKAKAEKFQKLYEKRVAENTGKSFRAEDTNQRMTYMEEKGWVTGPKGVPVPPHIAELKISPKWKDVTFNPNPDGKILVRGIDQVGNVKPVYSPQHNNESAAAKFSRVSEMISKWDSIDKQVRADMSKPETKENATVAALIMHTSMRPGSEESSHFGATTLEGRHVVEQKKALALIFTGKSGVRWSAKVTDETLANDLRARAKAAGEKGKLFNTTDEKVREYVDSLDGGNFKTKDIRTAVATKMAIEKIESMTPPKDAKEYKKKVKEVAEHSANKLHNGWTVCLQKYINPNVFLKWRKPEWGDNL